LAEFKLQSMTTKKHHLFVGEPLRGKPVTGLAGIGPDIGRRLEANGFDKAYVVLGQFLILKKNRYLFIDWLKDIGGANNKQANDCYMALREWCDRFGAAAAGDQNNNRASKPKRPRLQNKPETKVWGAKSVSPEVKDVPKVAAATLRTESRANLKEVKDDPKVTRPQVNLREEKPFICAACKKQFLSKGSQTM